MHKMTLPLQKTFICSSIASIISFFYMGCENAGSQTVLESDTKGESIELGALPWKPDMYSLESLGVPEFSIKDESKVDKSFFQSIEEVLAQYPQGERVDFSNKITPKNLSGQGIRGKEIEDSGLGSALQVEVLERINNPWAHGVDISPEFSAYDAGDSFLITMNLKSLSSTDESGEGKLTLQVKNPANKQNAGPILAKSISVGKEKQFVAIPFKSVKAGDRLFIQFLFGTTKPQEMLISDVNIIKYGKFYALEDLPKSSTTYYGMELDAKWREEAHQRILDHRMVAKTIEVYKDGKPVVDADISVDLLNHDFNLGAAINIRKLVGEQTSAENKKKYQSIIKDSFNMVTIENGLKWKLYRYFKEDVPPAIEWIRENDLKLRGHTLVWPGWKKSPPELKELSKDKEAFRNAIMERIQDFASRYTDIITEWDVVNEPFTNTDFMKVLGKDIILDIFNETERVNPEVTQYLNDFAILAGNHQAHQDDYYEWVKYLKENNAPLDGVGFQGHFRSPIPPTELWNRIERFAPFGYEMQITEYDFDESDVILQTRFLRDFLTVVFSHPQMKGFICWTLSTKLDRFNQAFLDDEFNPKLMLKAWNHLTKNVWTTYVEGRTATNGEMSFRAFKGDYKVKINWNGEEFIRELNFSQDGVSKIEL